MFPLPFQDSKDTILDLLILVLHVSEIFIHFVPSILSLCSLYIYFSKERTIFKSQKVKYFKCFLMRLESPVAKDGYEFEPNHMPSHRMGLDPLFY